MELLRTEARMESPRGTGEPVLCAMGYGCWTDSEQLETALLSASSRQDFVAEAGASRKSVGPWELFFGT
jgi:hypothetical protein